MVVGLAQFKIIKDGKYLKQVLIYILLPWKLVFVMTRAVADFIVVEAATTAAAEKLIPT